MTWFVIVGLCDETTSASRHSRSLNNPPPQITSHSTQGVLSRAHECIDSRCWGPHLSSFVVDVLVVVVVIGFHCLFVRCRSFRHPRTGRRSLRRMNGIIGPPAFQVNFGEPSAKYFSPSHAICHFRTFRRPSRRYYPIFPLPFRTYPSRVKALGGIAHGIADQPIGCSVCDWVEDNDNVNTEPQSERAEDR